MTELKISYELNQSVKKQPGINYAITFIYYITHRNLSQPMCTLSQPEK